MRLEPKKSTGTPYFKYLYVAVKCDVPRSQPLALKLIWRGCAAATPRSFPCCPRRGTMRISWQQHPAAPPQQTATAPACAVATAAQCDDDQGVDVDAGEDPAPKRRKTAHAATSEYVGVTWHKAGRKRRRGPSHVQGYCNSFQPH